MRSLYQTSISIKFFNPYSAKVGAPMDMASISSFSAGLSSGVTCIFGPGCDVITYWYSSSLNRLSILTGILAFFGTRASYNRPKSLSTTFVIASILLPRSTEWDAIDAPVAPGLYSTKMNRSWSLSNLSFGRHRTISDNILLIFSSVREYPINIMGYSMKIVISFEARYFP